MSLRPKPLLMKRAIRSVPRQTTKQKAMKTLMIPTTHECALTEYNFDTGACRSRALQPLDSHLVELARVKGGTIPGMPDFRFCLFRHVVASHYQILKGRAALIIGGVCWGGDGEVWQQLLEYRNAQLPWVPTCFFSRIPPSYLPWSAVLSDLEFGTLSNDERGLLEQFRRRLVSSLIHQAFAQS